MARAISLSKHSWKGARQPLRFEKLLCVAQVYPV